MIYIPQTASSAAADALGAVFGAVIFIWLIGIGILVGIVALITWVIKKIWYAGRGERKPKPKPKQRWAEDDWLIDAQERQQKKYEYSDPQWSYNKKTRMWVDSDQMDEKERRKANEKVRENWKTYQSQTGQWSPTGWYYNVSTGKWEPPEHPSDIEWRWNEEKQIWVDAGKERRMKRYREYHKDKPPTFEEWKAQREQELKNQQKQNNTPEE